MHDYQHYVPYTCHLLMRGHQHCVHYKCITFIHLIHPSIYYINPFTNVWSSTLFSGGGGGGGGGGDDADYGEHDEL
jgi:hypothetical protein